MVITGAYAAKVGAGLVSSLYLAVKARYSDVSAANQQIVTAKRSEMAAASKLLPFKA